MKKALIFALATITAGLSVISNVKPASAQVEVNLVLPLGGPVYYHPYYRKRYRPSYKYRGYRKYRRRHGRVYRYDRDERGYGRSGRGYGEYRRHKNWDRH